MVEPDTRTTFYSDLFDVPLDPDASGELVIFDGASEAERTALDLWAADSWGTTSPMGVPPTVLAVVPDDASPDGAVHVPDRWIGELVRGVVRPDVTADTLRCVLRMLSEGYLVLHPHALRSLVAHTRLPDTTPDDGVALVPNGALDTLSAREDEVVRLIAAGLTDKMIARDLGIADGTVRVHVREVLRKLDVSNRTQAALIYVAARGSPSYNFSEPDARG